MKPLTFFIIFFCFLAFTTLPSFSQTNASAFDRLMQEGLQLEKSLNEKGAFGKYKDAQALQPTQLDALYKCSEICSRIGNREKNTTSRDRYYNSSLAFAKMALRYHPQSDQSNLAMSIALGRIALTKSGKEKIIAVKEIKSYAETAIAINPSNFKAWHVLGKWNYEVSNLNIFEKAAVKLFYGGLPESSFSAAIKAYEKAAALSPYFCLNYLELAKAYKKNGQTDKGINILKKLIELASYTEDDARIKAEAGKLLQEWV